MCREVLDIEPYQFQLRSPERGKAWETISSHLNATSHPKFRVTPRSVRDRCNLLTKKFQVRLNREERVSGISDDNSELDNLLEEIFEKEKAAKEKLDNGDEDKKNLLRMRRRQRKRTLERVGQTAKRKGKEEGPEAEKSKSRKSRKSTGEAVEYLKERASKEIQLREQELEMRKKEHDSMSQREREKNEQQDKMLSTMLTRATRTAADDDDAFKSAAKTITGFTFPVPK